MDKEHIVHYLKAIGANLANNNQRGKILLVGGAAMLLVVGNRDATRDVDALFESNSKAIRRAIVEVAAQEGLPYDWLNDDAKEFIYSKPPTTLWRRFGGLDIYMPSLDYILAMKIVAGRNQDIEDARAIVEHIGLQSPQDVSQMLQKYIPSQYLTANMQYIVEELFSER